MTQERWLELPEHVVAKVEKVLGIRPSELPEHDLVSLIEELCDTALMFEREERGAVESPPEKPSSDVEGTPAPQP